MSVLHFMWCGALLAGAVQFGAVARAASADPEMVIVPAGAFLRGDDAGEADERPQRRIELPTFAIDRTEVTREAYSQCVAKGACPPPVVPPGALPTPAATEPPAAIPVVYVSWSDATAYCAFVGKRLPSEAEWEKAARGTDGRRYPWGNEFACKKGNFGNFAGDGRCADEGAKGRPLPVGSYPGGASPYGALNLAGNVWEWVADAYAADAYQKPPTRPPAARGQALAKPGSKTSQRRVLRGGGCCSIFGLPRSADRLALPPTYRDTDIGFRCAASESPGAEASAPTAPGR